MIEALLSQTDADDFARIVEPHLAQLLRVAERLGGSVNRDDIVQEALINAWTKRASFDPRRGSVGGWLLAIVADQARKSWRRRLVILGRDIAGPDRNEDDHLDIEAAVRRLPPRQRLAVDCHYFAGLSVSETAAVMKCSEGTVKSTLSDARSNLRPQLEVRS